MVSPLLFKPTSFLQINMDVRSLLHDETIYPDPLSFYPERFLDKNGRLNRAIRNPLEIAFGFGRRLALIIYYYKSLFTNLLAEDAPEAIWPRIL